MSRFDYVEYDEIAATKQLGFKNLCMGIDQAIEEMLPFDKATIAAKTKAINHLEICYMWLGKALRDEQIARNGGASLQEQRNNS